MALNNAPDLTKNPPRSARVRLGGYTILPRMLDKGRATIAGKHGEYKYACPLDERFLEFVGIDPGALKKQLARLPNLRSNNLNSERNDKQRGRRCARYLSASVAAPSVRRRSRRISLKPIGHVARRAIE